MNNKKYDKVYVAIKVEDDLPPLPQIVTVLIDGRIPMMAQIRPSENGPEWWTLGMATATKIEEKKKCVTHWLKPVENVFVLTEQEYMDNYRLKEPLLKCVDLLRDIDLYGDISMPKKTLSDCSNIATKGLKELHEEYPFLIDMIKIQ